MGLLRDFPQLPAREIKHCKKQYSNVFQSSKLVPGSAYKEKTKLYFIVKQQTLCKKHNEVVTSKSRNGFVNPFKSWSPDIICHQADEHDVSRRNHLERICRRSKSTLPVTEKCRNELKLLMFKRTFHYFGVWNCIMYSMCIVCFIAFLINK